MNGLSWMNQQVTRQRAGSVTDSYGNTVEDWTNTDDLDIDGVSVQPVTAAEIVDSTRDAIVRRWAVYDPAASDVVGTDRIVFNGDVYLIDGEPSVYQSGVLDHSSYFITDFRG